MWMQIYSEDGFLDRFDSKVIENLINCSPSVTYLRREEGKNYYWLKKSSIQGLVVEMEEELVRQREKSLFKGIHTKTLKELEIIIKILNIIDKDLVVKNEEEVVLFITQEREELLEI